MKKNTIKQLWIRYVDKASSPIPFPQKPCRVIELHYKVLSEKKIRLKWFKFMFLFLRKGPTPKSWKSVANTFPLVYSLDLFCLVTGHLFYTQEHISISYLKEGKISFERMWSSHIWFVPQKYLAIRECVHFFITDVAIL